MLFPIKFAIIRLQPVTQKGVIFLRIALCDDEKDALDSLKAYINTYCTNQNLTAQLDLFFSGEDFLSSPQHYDMVFMDIYLTGISGMETVRELGSDASRQVVFTTTSREHAVEAFGLDAAHYLIKPLTEENVADALSRCLARIGVPTDKIITFKSTQGIQPVAMMNIIYIEVFNKISIVHIRTGDIHVYTPLDAIFEMLDNKCFLKVQRSFVVNMNDVESFLTDRVILQNGVEIMLSRSNRQELKDKYQKFLFDLARRGKR